jgi:hypothetical protein
MGKRERKYAAAVVTALVSTPALAQTRLAIMASLFVFLLALIFTFTNVANAQGQTPSNTPKAQKKTDDNAPPVAWSKVPDAEKKVLAPLEKEWKDLPGHQHRKLIGAAKTYPKLKPIEQERFQERLRGWSSLTPAQRNTAREKFQSLNSLTPDKQQELKARWNEKKAAQADSATPTPAAPSNK